MKQIYIPYQSSYQTAKCLDRKRLTKQIQVCEAILSGIEGLGSVFLKQSLLVSMYREHKKWLEIHLETLKLVKAGKDYEACQISASSQGLKPFWMTKEFCLNHKQHLFALDPENYQIFKKYGRIPYETYINGDEVEYYTDQGQLKEKEPLSTLM